MPHLWRIPKTARPVFRGKYLDIYRWRQRMFDGSYGTFEMGKTRDVVFVLPILGGRIIVAKQRQPHSAREYMGFIGGHVNDGETALQAAKRELLEETGMESSDWKYMYKEERSGRVNQTFYYYAARDCRKIAGQSLDAGEKIRLLGLDVDGLIGVAGTMIAGNKAAHIAMMKYDRRSRTELEKVLFGNSRVAREKRVRGNRLSERPPKE